MKSMMKKTTVREIKNSLGRYLAILAIVALGVGFFAGLKVSRSAMVETGNEYWNSNYFYDFQLLSSIGFEQEDVEHIEDLLIKDGESIGMNVEAGISFDFLYLDESGSESAMKAYDIPVNINQVVLVEGRMPNAPNECLMDSNAVGTGIGDIIRFSENNEEETIENFIYEEYTVVGRIQSPRYVNIERGSTALGGGSISGFIFFPREGLHSEYYTEIMISYHHNYKIYSEQYDLFIEEREKLLEDTTETVVLARYDNLIAEANKELADAEVELADKKGEAEDELAEAKADLEDGKLEIEDGKLEIEEGLQEVKEGKVELVNNLANLTSGQQEIEDGKAQIVAALDTIKIQKMQLIEALPYQPDIADQITMIEIQETQLLSQLEALKLQEIEIVNGLAEIELAEEKLAKIDIELVEAEEELVEAQETLEEGIQEYDAAALEFNDEIANANEEIADVKVELAEQEQPDSYVLDRNANIGYVSFENDTNIIEAIAGVFPIFFFMVATLVCITTMNRMVEDQRTQIGILKALGYSKVAIMSKYLFYSGSASLIGCIGGFLIGSYLFPYIIWEVYGIMYGFKQDIIFVFDTPLALISLIVALVCTLGSTYFSCRAELNSVSAELIRPKAPKNGKRIFLEKFGLIWKPLPFLHKVAIRNVFRYKRRFIMMVLGISGCSALLVTGYGIKDSIQDVINQQYDEIQMYDMSIVFDEELTPQEKENFEASVAETVEGTFYVREEGVDIEGNDVAHAVTMIIPENTQELTDFLDLHTNKKTAVPFPEKGEVLITEKMSQKLGVIVGETISIVDADREEMKVNVSGIVENYVSNYIYLLPETYIELMGEDVDFETAYLLINEGLDYHQVSAQLLNLENVSRVTSNDSMRERFTTMLDSLDYIVLLVIVCAAALAFIVLYNLTNINITERIREIATIKVLGFYPSETASYVFRENIVLTAIGSLVGLVMGYFLHQFVMYNIDITAMTFDVRIFPKSYFYSFLLTFGFGILVNCFMLIKLNRINMAESLKSIE